MLEKDIKKVIDGVYPFHMPGHKRQKQWLEGLYDLDITEISGAAGFGTLRTLNRAFIKQTGMSPSEYKKENRAEHLGASAP
jgi:AraC-like DNA-binding protein